MYKPLTDIAGTTSSVSEDSPLDQILPPLGNKLELQTINKLKERLGSVDERQLKHDQGDAKVNYGITEVNGGPFIRLPCYNVPIQCAYEMVYSDLGRFIDSPKHLLKFKKSNYRLKQVTVGGITITRNPPDMDMFVALLKPTTLSLQSMSSAVRLAMSDWEPPRSQQHS